MNLVDHVMPDFPADAFAGTATYYVHYRVPYPKALLDDMIKRAGITGEGKLFDLACGPGRVALSIAALFRDIWAIDLEPEMIEAGKKEATSRGVKNIKWIIGKAEDMEAPPASFELITIGEAFHRLDQQLVAKQTLHWLKLGCCLAIMGCSGIMSGKEPWQRIVADIVRQWTSRNPSNADSFARVKPGRGPDHDELVLRETGFGDVGSYSFVEPHDWTIETIIGNLYSTSFCSKNVLGDNAEAFETDMKAALLAHDPSGNYRENMRFGHTIGKKPR